MKDRKRDNGDSAQRQDRRYNRFSSGDARWGRAAGLMAKGYKLHTVWSHHAGPETWEVSKAETMAAHRLLPQLTRGGYLLADGNDQ